MRKFIAAVAAIAAISAAAPAWADTDTDNMDVTLNVNKACSVLANPLTFSATFVGGSAIDAQTSVTAKCTVGTTYDISFGNGLHFNTGSSTRELSNGTDNVPYGLYSDTARASALTLISGTGSGNDQAYDVYGRIPASATAVPTGTYTDTVVVTLTY